MINFSENCRIYVGIEPIDFRCGLNKLVPLAKACFDQDPRDRNIFVFRNRNRTDIKMLLLELSTNCSYSKSRLYLDLI